MKTVSNRTRSYRSPLRDEQAESTRDRILDATGRVLASGIAGITIPAVAREAGVSIPTVYRNFKSKRELLEAIYPYAIRRARVEELKPPSSIADFRDCVRTIFERLESFDDIERAAMASRGAEEVRHVNIDARLAMARRIVEAIAPALSAEDRERLARVVIVLTMSATARMLRDHLGRSVDEAIDDIDWAVRAAIAGRTAKGTPA